MRRLDAEDLPLNTVALARELLGKVLIHDTLDGRIAGRVVETEAYPPGDPACHAFIGQTARNRSLFLRRGHFYVYRIYGRSLMLNLSSEGAGVGAGVLFRALEPIAGIELMKKGRPHLKDEALARGPGRLADALRITPDIDGRRLDRDGILGLASDAYAAEIAQSVRIGITKNAEQNWRFFLVGNRSVSGPRHLRSGVDL